MLYILNKKAGLKISTNQHSMDNEKVLAMHQEINYGEI
jgi:hypothetical protein